MEPRAVTPTRPALVGLGGPVLGDDERVLLARLRPRGVLLFERNVTDHDQLRALTREVDTILRDAGVDVPLIAADTEGGIVFPLHPALDPGPGAATLGWIDRPELTEAVHAERATHLRAIGVNLVLAPVADVDVAGNPVIGTRAFGREPALVARHVSAAVRGLRRGGVACCAKHWPGHGASRVDSHLELPVLDRDDTALRTIDEPPFAAAVDAGVDAVMAAHVRVPAWQAEGSGPVGVDPVAVARLRRTLAFDGPLLSDAIEMQGLAGFGPGDLLAAGLDLVLFAAPIPRVESALSALEPADTDPWTIPEPTGPVPAVDVPWHLALRFDGARPDPWPCRWWVVDEAGDDRLLRVPGDPAAPLEGGHQTAPAIWERTLAPIADRVDVIRTHSFAGLSLGEDEGVALLSVRSGRFDDVAALLGALRPAVWLLAGAVAIDPPAFVPGVPVARCAEVRPSLLERVLRSGAI